MIEDRVIPGRMVLESKGGVTIVFVFANTAKKLEAPASSMYSPLDFIGAHFSIKRKKKKKKI